MKMNVPVPAGEEVGPKITRMISFVGAGFLCTFGINKWMDFEKKAADKKREQEKSAQLLESSPSS